MIYPKNPYCPFDKDYMCPESGNNGNNENNGATGNGNTGNGNNNGNSNNGNIGNGNIDNDCMHPENGNGNGGNMTGEELFRYICELEFALTDLNLYLDTHPDNAEALEMFTKLAATLKSLKADYARKFAPITSMDVKNETPFEWVSPKHKWPWQA